MFLCKILDLGKIENVLYNLKYVMKNFLYEDVILNDNWI